MKMKSFLAFLFTLFALLLVLSGAIYSLYERRSTGYCNDYSVELELETDELELTPCEGELVRLLIKNTGSDAIYKISLDGPNWAMVKPDEIKIKSDEIKETSIYMSPPINVKGEFEITVKIRSDCLVKEETLSVKV